MFGSARFAVDHPVYNVAREVGSGLSRLGFTVMTGGGPGIMEAAIIVMPGGVGTMDEFFESLTLIKTRKIEQFPIVLIGKQYSQRLIELLELMVTAGTIDPADMNLLLITDSVEAAMEHIQKTQSNRFTCTVAW